MLCQKTSMDRFYRKNRLRFCDQNRIVIDPDWFSIAIVIAIAFSSSGANIFSCEIIPPSCATSPPVGDGAHCDNPS